MEPTRTMRDVHGRFKAVHETAAKAHARVHKHTHEHYTANAPVPAPKPDEER